MQNKPARFFKQRIGAQGEEIIANYLQAQGATILDKNWRVKEGEIDLVAQNASGVILIVEVKTRSSLAYGHPLEAIDRDKAMRLQRLALAWLVTHRRFGASFQIDCAAVVFDRTGEHSIDYRMNVL